MGSGIAQKIATEGFPVLLVDSDAERAAITGNRRPD